jgi:hypothetical protein
VALAFGPMATPIASNLRFYAPDEKRVNAAASDAVGVIRFGGADVAELPPVALATASSEVLAAPRLAPEGDELFVQVTQAGGKTAPAQLRSYALIGGRWELGGDLAIDGLALGPGSAPGVPSRRGGARKMMIDLGGGHFALIVERAALAWAVVDTYDPSALNGSTQMSQPSLTADGARLVFADVTSPPNPAAIVSTAVWVAGSGVFLPDGRTPTLLGATSTAVEAPYLTPDCNHLYVTGTSVLRFDL